MEHEPPPRDPESEARGHELRDVALCPILILLIGPIRLRRRPPDRHEPRS